MQWQSSPKPNTVVATISLRLEVGLLNSSNVSSCNSSLEANMNKPIILNGSIAGTSRGLVMC